MTQMQSLSPTVQHYLPEPLRSSSSSAFQTKLDGMQTKLENGMQSALSFAEEFGSIKAVVKKGRNDGEVCDVCVKVQCGGLVATTRTLRGEQNPEWNQEFELPIKSLDGDVTFVLWKDNSLETSHCLGSPITIPVELLMANVVDGVPEPFDIAEKVDGFGELQLVVVFIPPPRREELPPHPMRSSSSLGQTQYVPQAMRSSSSLGPAQHVPPAMRSTSSLGQTQNIPQAMRSTSSLGQTQNVPHAMRSSSSVSQSQLVPHAMRSSASLGQTQHVPQASALQSSVTKPPSALNSTVSLPGNISMPNAMRSQLDRDVLAESSHTVMTDVEPEDRRTLRPDGVGLLELTVIGATNLPNKNVYVTCEVGSATQRTVSASQHEWNKQMSFSVSSLQDRVSLHAWLEDGGAEHLGTVRVPLSCGHGGVMSETLCLNGRPTEGALKLSMRFIPSVHAKTQPAFASQASFASSANGIPTVQSLRSNSFRSDAPAPSPAPSIPRSVGTRTIPLPSFNDGRPQSFSAPKVERTVEAYQYRSGACHLGQHDYREAPQHAPAKPLNKEQWKDDPFHGWRASGSADKAEAPRGGSRKEHMLYAIREDSPKGVTKEHWVSDPFYQWLPNRGNETSSVPAEDTRFEQSRLASLPSFSQAPLSRTKMADYSSPPKTRGTDAKNKLDERDWKQDAFYGWLPGRGSEEATAEIDVHRGSHLAQLPSFSCASASAPSVPRSLGATQAVSTRPHASLGTLLVRVCRAHDLRGDSCDPFVRVSMGSSSYRTRTCTNTDNPVWNSDTFRFEVVNLRQELTCQVFDEDALKSNELMGSLAIPVQVAHDLGGQMIAIREALVGQGELELELTFEPK